MIYGIAVAVVIFLSLLTDINLHIVPERFANKNEKLAIIFGLHSMIHLLYRRPRHAVCVSKTFVVVQVKNLESLKLTQCVFASSSFLMAINAPSIF